MKSKSNFVSIFFNNPKIQANRNYEVISCFENHHIVLAARDSRTTKMRSDEFNLLSHFAFSEESSTMKRLSMREELCIWSAVRFLLREYYARFYVRSRRRSSATIRCSSDDKVIAISGY
jgi:hypothetical protein